MKHLFAMLLLLGSLTSCSRNDPAPAPAPEPIPTSALLGGTWDLQSERTLVTPTDGSPASTLDVPIMTGSAVSIVFLSATHYTLDLAPKPNGTGYHFEGLYSYRGKTLDFVSFYSWNTGFIVPQTVEVIELNAHKLVTEWHWSSFDTRYITTHTYSRQ